MLSSMVFPVRCPFTVSYLSRLRLISFPGRTLPSCEKSRRAYSEYGSIDQGKDSKGLKVTDAQDLHRNAEAFNRDILGKLTPTMKDFSLIGK